MKASNTDRLKLETLLKSAVDGRLSLDELNSCWTFEEYPLEVLNVLFQDLEEGITHLPGTFFSNKTDYKMWRRQYEYAVLMCDLLLIDLMSDPRRWLNIRSGVLSNLNDYSVESIEQEIFARLKSYDTYK